MFAIVSNESTSPTWPSNSGIDQRNQGKPIKVMPDFAQTYSFIGNVLDPNITKHLQRLKQIDPTNVEVVLLSMRNLSVNLISPEAEDHQSEYEIIAPIKWRIYLMGLILVDLVIWSLIFPGDLKMNASCVMRLTTVDLVIGCPC